MYLCGNSISSVRLFLHFYTLSATRVLNSFEELCIMRAAAENSFARVLNHGGESATDFSNEFPGYDAKQSDGDAVPCLKSKQARPL